MKLDKPVLTNNTDIDVDGDSVVASTPIFGGTQIVAHQVHRRPAGDRARPPEVVRRRGEWRRRRRGRRRSPVPDVGATGAAKVVDRHVEEATVRSSTRPPIVVSGGRGLGEASKYEMVE